MSCSNALRSGLAALWVLLACLVPASSASAQALVIDRLSAAQRTLTATPGDDAASVSRDASILGGERDLWLRVTDGASATVQVANGPGLVLSNGGGGAAALLSIVYDGPDKKPRWVDHTGLGGVDLTNGGLNESFMVSFLNVGVNTRARVVVYTDAKHCSNYTVSSPFPLVNTPFDLAVTYEAVLANFTKCDKATGPADFTRVGALVFEVTMDRGEPVPLQLTTGSITTQDFYDGTTLRRLTGRTRLLLLVGPDGWPRLLFPGWSRVEGPAAYEALHQARPEAAPLLTERPGLDGADGYQLGAVYPNPSAGAATFELRLEAPQHVRVALYDLMGRLVAHVHDGVLAPQVTHRFTVDGGGLPSGSYLCRITGASFEAHRLVTFVR